METIVPIVGALCLGILIGWLIGFFLMRMETFTPKAFAAIIGVLLGATVTQFLGPDRTVWWFYPIGLILGIMAHAIIAILYGEKPKGTAFSKMFGFNKKIDSPQNENENENEK